MKKKILLFLLAINLATFSQSKKTFCGKIQYTQILNFGFEFIEEYELVFTNNWSYSEEINVKKKESFKTSIKENGGVSNVNVVGRKNETPNFYYNTNKDFFFRINFSDNIFIVKEDLNFSDWKFINETKKIANFECKKAMITFRGRTFFAWYTLSIALPYGPWKARGLPGLILEFYEENDNFHIYTKKITVSDTLDCNKNLPNTQLLQAISIKKFLKEREKLIALDFEKMSSRQSKGAKPIRIDKNCEDCNKGLEIFDEN